MRTSITVTVLGSLLATLAGCGDDGGSDAPPATDVPLESFCTEYIAAYCAAAERCGCTFMTDCATDVAMACPPPDATTALAAGSFSYDPSAAGRWIATVRMSDCDTAPRCSAGGCVGIAALGDPCGDHVGCVDGTVCSGGACITPTADGEPCSEGLSCASRRCEAGACVPAAENGTGCADDDECESGRCDFATGRCAAKDPEGTLCAENSDCESGYCDRDLAIGAGNCAPRLEDGMACDEHDQCVGGYCRESVCGGALCRF